MTTTSCGWLKVFLSAVMFNIATATISCVATEAAKPNQSETSENSAVKQPIVVPALPYDLKQVRYIQSFAGSTRAKEFLSRQGFVVTDEQFSQIFVPYLPSTKTQLPVFITVDSVWHTYHVLLEEGVQNLELCQARLLKRFSERLHRLATDSKNPSKPIYHDLALFAAVGWAIQDSTAIQRLPAEQLNEVTKALAAIESGGSALFFDLPLQPENYRPSGFYTKTPELSVYFTARRWYALSAFRIKSESETLRALHLMLLIESNAELKRLYRQLTIPAATMVGPSDDPGITEYAQLAAKISKGPLSEDDIPRILANFRFEAKKLTGPKINDQFLLPKQFANRDMETKGLRLFGGCQLPSAILFQNTTNPKIAERDLPSGLDIFSAGPLSCEAGRRALKTLEPNQKVYDAICQTKCGELPSSLHGNAMQLLKLLHEPLPKSAPQSLQSLAWQDKQLSTSLGAWAEERHTWVLHTKTTGGMGCSLEFSPGYVSPYPKFYRQLGKLARQAADVLLRITPEPDFIQGGQLWLNNLTDDADERKAAMAAYFKMNGKNLDAANVLDRAKAYNALNEMAQRCVDDKATDTDRCCMKAFLTIPNNSAKLLPDFAMLCDQLATIADKELAGHKLNEKEIYLIQEYGCLLSQFHFYEGDTRMIPRDDFPCVAPVFNNPRKGTTLHVGVVRPEAIYVVLFIRNNLVLHRGAVLSYREFSRKSNENIDDDTWKKEIDASQAPSPPAWTTTFRVASNKQERKVSIRDIAAQIQEGKVDEETLPRGHEVTQVLVERLVKKWQLQKTPPPMKQENKLSEKDRKAAEKALEVWKKEKEESSSLFQSILTRIENEDAVDLLDKLVPIISEEDASNLRYEFYPHLNWEPHRKKLLALVHDPRPEIADWATDVVKGWLETDDLVSLINTINQQPPILRVRYCSLIGSANGMDAERKRVLATALRDPAWEVRQRAAQVVAEQHLTSDELTAGVRHGLEDGNPKVVATMVGVAIKLKLTDTAHQLHARLQKLIKTYRPNDKDLDCLAGIIIEALGQFKYQPARDTLHELLVPNSLLLKENGPPFRTNYEVVSKTFMAFLLIEPKATLQLLSDIFRRPECPDHLLHIAVEKATSTDNIEYLKTMLPLFKDVKTSTRQAAKNLAGVLERLAGQHDPESIKLFEQICNALLRQCHGSHADIALEALKYFDPTVAAQECIVVAIDQQMSKENRTAAITLLQDAPKPGPILDLLPLIEESSEDSDLFCSISYYAAETIGRLAAKLDPQIPKEAELRQTVKKAFNDMLAGPRCLVAAQGLLELSDSFQDDLIRIVLDQSQSTETRTQILALISEHCGPKYAKKLTPLLGENTQLDKNEMTIALHAAETIARMVNKDLWYSNEESAADYLRKARAWAETAEEE